MDIIDQLYNSHVSAATLDALDKYRIHKDQALHGYHVLKEQLTEDQAAALDLSLIHISEPTRLRISSRMPSSA